jgi:IS30 family transposase
VSREIRRYDGREAYRTSKADVGGWQSALRPKPCLLALNRRVRHLAAGKLMLQWSPEQISGWLKDKFPNDASMHSDRRAPLINSRDDWHGIDSGF